MQRTLLKWLAALGTAALVTACGGGGSGSTPAATTSGTTPPVQATTIAQAVMDTPELSALRSSISFVDEDSDEKLMPLLANAGDKTLFAPNNAAFDKLAVELIGPGSKAADLLKPEYKDDLRDVIRTNLTAGRLVQSSLVNGTSLTVDLGSASSTSSASVTTSGSGTASVSVSTSISSSATASVSTTTGTVTTPAVTPTTPTGTPTTPIGTVTTPTGTGTSTLDKLNNFKFFLSIKINGGVITITDGQGRVATIKLADILAGNGVIHIIDNALMPPKPMLGKSILDVAQKTPELSSLV